MNVTDQINKYKILYGSSDNTNPATIAAAKKLNYAEGASIQKPSKEDIFLIPQSINYNDTVGLFGTENHFWFFLFLYSQTSVSDMPKISVLNLGVPF